MIPRYIPTYSIQTIHQSLAGALSDDRTEALESQIRDYYGVKHVFLLQSGKTCLNVILRALNKPGKVIMPAYNCNVVPEAAVFAGYSPLFLDAELDTLNVPVERFVESLTDNTSAIIAVSLFGMPYDVRPLKEIACRKGILLIEDAASAMGGRIDGSLAGTIGDVGVISFQDTKPLSAKTGGAILTNDDPLAEKIAEVIRDFKKQKNTLSLYVASIFRRTATARWLYPLTLAVYRNAVGEQMFEKVQAPQKAEEEYLLKCSSFSIELILRQWEKFEENITRRRWIAGQYRKALQNNSAFHLPKILPGIEPVWIQYPLLVENKMSFYKHMQKNGVDITWTYRYTCAQEFPQTDCPNAETIARSILSLPCYPDLTDSEVQKICEAAAAYDMKSNMEQHP